MSKVKIGDTVRFCTRYGPRFFKGIGVVYMMESNKYYVNVDLKTYGHSQLLVETDLPSDWIKPLTKLERALK